MIFTPEEERAFAEGVRAGFRLGAEWEGIGEIDPDAAGLQHLVREARRQHMDELLRGFHELLSLLEDRDLTQVLTHLSHAEIATALAGVSEEYQDVLLAHVSRNAAAEIRDDIATRVPLRRADVEAAQARIGAVVRSGIIDGRLALREAGGGRV